MLVNLEEKIDKFTVIGHGTNATIINEYGDVNLNDDLPDLYRLGSIRVKYSDNAEYVTAEELRSRKEFYLYQSSKLTKYNIKRPIYHKSAQTSGNTRLKIYPYKVAGGGINGVQVDYIKKPFKPNWAYIVVNNKPLYNTTPTVDFELHASEETELVYRILTLAGVAIEKPQLTQVAAGLQTAQIQQEKQ